MAIFSGSWQDEAGAAFDPGSFVINTNASGTILSVTGDGDPSPNGTYREAGQFMGEPFYAHDTKPFFIWWDGMFWSLSDKVGAEILFRWHNSIPFTLPGTYLPILPATGNPVVAWQVGGTFRLRIHGRRHGSGAKPDYYPAGPNYVAAHYDFSPRQWMARQTFGTIMKEYFTFPPFAPVIVTGMLTPDIIGTYGGQDFHESKAHWYRMESMYHIYWFPDWTRWFIAREFPGNPQNGDPFWFRTDPSPYGAYGPWQGAMGIATVIAPP